MRTSPLYRCCIAIGLVLSATMSASRMHAQPNAKTSAMFGRVLADSSESPLIGATIGIAALRLAVVTDSLGRFRMTGISPGRQLVTVSQAGFVSLQTYMSFVPADSVDADILLTPLRAGSAQTIERVNVTASRTPRGLEDFERRRARGNGDFLTEETIRKASSGMFVDVVRRLPGLQMSRSQGGFGAYASAGRGANRGRPCFVSVMIDRNWVYEGKAGQLPFDLNSLSPDIVVAVEYYRGLSSIPSEFGKQLSTCGTLIIWTRQG